MAEGSEPISIRVSSQDGTEVYFKIKQNTQLSKLIDAYCERQGVDKTQIRFLYDGVRLAGTDTPAKLDMEDQDVIDAVLEQTGGWW